MVEATAIRVPIRLRDEIKNLRFTYRVDHFWNVVDILVELAKENPKEAKRIAALIKNSTHAQIVVMNFNPHYIKNLN